MLWLLWRQWLWDRTECWYNVVMIIYRIIWQCGHNDSRRESGCGHNEERIELYTVTGLCSECMIELNAMCGQNAYRIELDVLTVWFYWTTIGWARDVNALSSVICKGTQVLTQYRSFHSAIKLEWDSCLMLMMQGMTIFFGITLVISYWL